MKKLIILFFLFFIITNCSFNKVVNKHGVRNLNEKQTQLIINQSNTNDIRKILGPPSTKSSFDNDIFIYIERKTSSTKLTKMGKKKLLLNDVLVLEIDNTGILLSKKFYNKDDMKKIKFEESITGVNYSKKSFIFNVLSSLRQKIDDPLGKKRIKD